MSPKVGSVTNLVAGGMLRNITPVEDYRSEYGLLVKREDLSCPPPGPPFSKARGVYARITKRPESIIGALDTYHSQAGHAVARACQVLGKQCLNFYPEFKYEPGPRIPQLNAQELGATLIGLPAGRSAILYHAARKQCEAAGGYMMPNALKLEESVEETAKEVPYIGGVVRVIIPASSGTIAAGVIRGFRHCPIMPQFIIHLGYSRSHKQVLDYVAGLAENPSAKIAVVDEKYSYKDTARDGETPPWPCNPYYDLKAFRWWTRLREQSEIAGDTLFWNIG